MYKLQDLGIKDQAYYIIVTLNGSWLVDALYPQMQDEVFCKNIVSKFLGDYTYEECDTMGINEMVNDSYPELLQYRASKAV